MKRLLLLAAIPFALAALHTEVTKALAQPEFRKRLEEIGAEPVGNTPEQMADQIKSGTHKFAQLVRHAKVVIE